MHESEKKASVIVTGASSGIGAEIAREFSKNNYYVFLLGRSEQKLKEVQKTCSGPTETLAFDLRDIGSFEKTIIKALENKPPLEVLVNNAGIYHHQEFLQTSDATWEDQFAVNLMGPIRLTRLLWPIFVKNKKGNILNISSTLGLKPAPQTAAYSALKAALNNWTLTLAQEGGALNIRANAICPGIVDTPIHSFHALQEVAKNQILQNLSALQLLPSIGKPIHIAKAAYFLASDDSVWTTGSILSVDGGINIK